MNRHSKHISLLILAAMAVQLIACGSEPSGNGETTADDYESYIDSGITLVTAENAEEAMKNDL